MVSHFILFLLIIYSSPSISSVAAFRYYRLPWETHSPNIHSSMKEMYRSHSTAVNVWIANSKKQLNKLCDNGHDKHK